MPDLKFRDLAGQVQKLSSLRGSIVVISFWATWCAPCREELPRVAALQTQYQSDGVRFVAISVDAPKDRGKIEPFLRGHNLNLHAWTGADIGTLDRLQLGNIVPDTLILDRDGIAVGRIEGEAQQTDIRRYLDWMLHGEPAYSAPPPVILHTAPE